MQPSARAPASTGPAGRYEQPRICLCLVGPSRICSERRFTESENLRDFVRIARWHSCFDSETFSVVDNGTDYRQVINHAPFEGLDIYPLIVAVDA